MEQFLRNFNLENQVDDTFPDQLLIRLYDGLSHHGAIRDLRNARFESDRAVNLVPALAA